MAESLSNEFFIPTYEEVGAVKQLNGGKDCLWTLQLTLTFSVIEAPCTYLCGNSLGALSHRSKKLVEEELHVWSKR